MTLQYGEDDYDNMGEDDYDDYSKELNQYKKSKDRGRGEFRLEVVVHRGLLRSERTRSLSFHSSADTLILF